MAAEVQVHDGTQVAKAQARAERIRSHLADAAQEYATAIIEQDWKVLGFGSIEAWREAMFSGQRLAVETRRQVAELLSAEGQTLKEIGTATGASEATASRDLQSARTPPNQAGPSRNVTKARTGKVSPKTDAERQAARRKRERVAEDKQLADRVRQEMAHDWEGGVPAGESRDAAVKVIAGQEAPEPAAPPVTATTYGGRGIEETVQALGGPAPCQSPRCIVHRQSEAIAMKAERDQLAEENEKLRAKLAEATGKLAANLVPVLEKRLEKLDRENEKLSRGAKAARPCSAHRKAAEFITQCPECGRD